MLNRLRTNVRPMFVAALHRLLDDRFELGSSRSQRLMAFSRLLEPASEARLLEVMETGTPPPRWLIAECAELLAIAPEHFIEWRIYASLDPFDEAVNTVEAWLEERTRR